MAFALAQAARNLSHPSDSHDVIKLTGPECFFDAVKAHLSRYPHTLVPKLSTWRSRSWQRHGFVRYDGTFGAYHATTKLLRRTHYSRATRPVLLEERVDD